MSRNLARSPRFTVMAMVRRVIISECPQWLAARPDGRPEKEDRMQHPHEQRRWRLDGRRLGARATALAGSVALVSALGIAGIGTAGLASAARSAGAGDQAAGTCHLGNGIK